MSRLPLSLPNALTLLRLALVPVLLLLAWQQSRGIVVLLMAACFATDVLDGLLARLLHQQTELGARLDSIADFVFYLSIPLATWWAWPAILVREAPYFAVLVATVVVPAATAFAKFGTTTSYHTWAVKLAAAINGLGVLVLLAFDQAWLFHTAVLFSVFAACEEILITWILDRPRSNLHSLWHAWRARRGD